MKNASRLTLYIGIIFLSLSIINGLSTNLITPEFQRAEILSGLAGVILMLVSLLLTEIIPDKIEKQTLKGSQEFFIDLEIDDLLKKELAWGSHMFLTSTSASTILIWWDKKIILKRGIFGKGNFKPGDICKRTTKNNKIFSLMKTKLYPGRFEFDSICPDLPSVLIYPLEGKGYVILGGWSERCFTKSDELWLEGWSKKLLDKLANKEN